MAPHTRCFISCRLLLGLSVIFGSASVPESTASEATVCEDELARQGIYLPYRFDRPFTPPTKTLGADQAQAVLQRDWLFQAEGLPLEQRAADEIRWARQLAARLARHPRTPDLEPELSELDALEQRLAQLADDASKPASAEVLPQWIWFPEGRPAEDSPVEARYFRRTFDVPPGSLVRAELRVAADDTCEVFLNGVPLGTHPTWQHPAVFPIEAHLRPGTNVIAVRAENRPAPVQRNPAGLIVWLTWVPAEGNPVHLVSDTSWLAAREESAHWQQVEFDDSAWNEAMLAADGGLGPWQHRLLQRAPLDAVSRYADTPAERKELYFAVRRVKRRIALANPVVDFSKLLFIDQPYPRGRVNDIHESIHRMGITATPGGRLLVLDGLHPGGQVRLLAPQAHPGSFWRPDLSFDGQRVLFCYKPHDGKAFHLYEMNLDGTGLRQLTEGDYDDIDPIYLPDGHILFTTTRGNSHVRCGPFIYSYILARCDADGNDIYLISYNGEPDFVPSLLNDGRVIYSRWEYSDKPLWRLQKLWATNPDGTGTAHFWGNQSVWPDHTSEPRAIPGSRRVMFSGVGHHDWWSGSIGIIDPGQGRDFPDGLTKVTADLRWPECSIPPVDPIEADDYHSAGRFTGYKTPYPLSEEDFLVSARGEPTGRFRLDDSTRTASDAARIKGKFRLYLMDVYGNRELIYEGIYNILHALPVRTRTPPPSLPERVVWPGTGAERQPVQPGTFYSADVYRGMPEVPRGKIKYLRVFQLDYKTYSTWEKTYRHSGPAVSIVQEEGVKRILSEVPVEDDGSVHFVAPAGYSLFFQLLDADRRCLQTMRSFTGLMPGEQRGCVGCHEQHSVTPSYGHAELSLSHHDLDGTRQPGAAPLAKALQRPPTELSPPPWGTESISYERFVQPVLDQYCVACHRGQTPGSHEPDLRLRPGHGPFREPYLTMIGPAAWGHSVPADRPGYGIAGVIPVESAYDQNDPAALTTLKPMQHLSYASRLVELAGSGTHHDVRADPLSLHRLIAWVDSCGVYHSEEELRALGDPDFPGIDRLPIRPRVATAPVVERP
jgi:hypothetical protein